MLKKKINACVTHILHIGARDQLFKLAVEQLTSTPKYIKSNAVQNRKANRFLNAAAEQKQKIHIITNNIK